MTATTPQASSPKRLGVNVFTAPGKAVVGERPRPFGDPLGWDPITSTLIYGEYDAVLVDTLATVAEAEALADWVALSLHVPSIDLVVGGDVLYNQCHMYVGDTTPESRRNWIEALDRLAALPRRSPSPDTRNRVRPICHRRYRTASATSKTSADYRRAPQPTKNCSTR
ncbi:MAG: hypothetical protein QOD97_663 [Mycobacterium sp.]|nr:hypothetical protein [Mycobacterium sp.]